MISQWIPLHANGIVNIEIPTNRGLQIEFSIHIHKPYLFECKSYNRNIHQHHRTYYPVSFSIPRTHIFIYIYLLFNTSIYRKCTWIGNRLRCNLFPQIFFEFWKHPQYYCKIPSYLLHLTVTQFTHHPHTHSTLRQFFEKMK